MQDRTILAKILDFHGGVENYQRLESMEVTMSARGFLSWAKGIQTLKQTRLKIYTQSPLVIIYDFPKPGYFAKFIGEEEVC